MKDLEYLKSKYEAYNQSFEQKRKISELLNTIIKYFCILILGFGVGLFLRKCSKTDKKAIIKERIVRDSINQTDTIINNIVRERIKIKTKLDTLNKIIYVPKQVIIKDSVLCDSLYSLALVQKKMISNDSILITKLNVNIKNYKQLDTIQSKTIDSLQRFPKGRFKWFMYGIGTGILIKSIIK